ncbi:Glycosyltransferase involved in cell wall bisynthesis [Parapedobacter luteus]|uniref:Glycosyltransferase involved in cell wall bisynthesis n=1 Tax=Parapedobacter luteus TaxID=623280 RepID=A0A1T4ZUW5_9SPHI|nr:glycosyltransferase family 2 protein [Parapedobacter luteus]SKB26299.1 Glycosyltransferase involved in cell wall bisynthesis [Parapedobacter luteus]
MAYPSCSCIVSTYNWPEALDLCLKSLLAQRTMPDEIIIADDGSRAETRLLIDRYQASSPIPIKHVWHPDDGFRKTIILNAAIQEAKGEYIIQIDGDIIVHNAFVKDHLAAAKPGQFVRGSRAMVNEDTSLLIQQNKRIKFHSMSKGVEHRFNAVRLPFLSRLIRTNPWSPADVKGCNMAFWKSDFELVNGYNNNLTGWGHEDIELAARFINNGIKKRHLKLAAVCYHIHHELNSRAHEKHNKHFYEEVLSLGLKRCANGYYALAEA